MGAQLVLVPLMDYTKPSYAKVDIIPDTIWWSWSLWKAQVLAELLVSTMNFTL